MSWSFNATPDRAPTITLAKEGHFEEAEKLEREALATAMRTAGPTALITRNSISNLATTLAYEKKTDESIALFEKLLEAASKRRRAPLTAGSSRFTWQTRPTSTGFERATTSACSRRARRTPRVARRSRSRAIP